MPDSLTNKYKTKFAVSGRDSLYAEKSQLDQVQNGRLEAIVDIKYG